MEGKEGFGGSKSERQAGVMLGLLQLSLLKVAPSQGIRRMDIREGLISFFALFGCERQVAAMVRQKEGKLATGLMVMPVVVMMEMVTVLITVVVYVREVKLNHAVDLLLALFGHAGLEIKLRQRREGVMGGRDGD